MTRFSLTVIFPKSRRPSGTIVKPRETTWGVVSVSMRSPSKMTSPSYGDTIARIVFSVVDLPAALGPSKHTISPGRASRLMFRRTSTGP